MFDYANIQEKRGQEDECSENFQTVLFHKKTINESADAKYHKSIGSIFGFGSCKDMNVTEETWSSIKKYAFNDGKRGMKKNSFLEKIRREWQKWECTSRIL